MYVYAPNTDCGEFNNVDEQSTPAIDIFNQKIAAFEEQVQSNLDLQLDLKWGRTYASKEVMRFSYEAKDECEDRKAFEDYKYCVCSGNETEDNAIESDEDFDAWNQGRIACEAELDKAFPPKVSCELDRALVEAAMLKTNDFVRSVVFADRLDSASQEAADVDADFDEDDAAAEDFAEALAASDAELAALDLAA
eukprot:tig00000057_g88.t1